MPPCNSAVDTVGRRRERLLGGPVQDIGGVETCDRAGYPKGVQAPRQGVVSDWLAQATAFRGFRY